MRTPSDLVPDKNSFLAGFFSGSTSLSVVFFKKRHYVDTMLVKYSQIRLNGRILLASTIVGFHCTTRTVEQGQPRQQKSDVDEEKNWGIFFITAPLPPHTHTHTLPLERHSFHTIRTAHAVDVQL